MASVLYIDESHLGRTVARLSLHRAGHEVLEAADGQAGLEAVARHRPDCVLICLAAPVVDAVEFLRRLRSEGSAPPVIVIASCPRRSTLDTCRKLGAAAVIDRPSAPEALAASVARALLSQERAAA